MRRAAMAAVLALGLSPAAPAQELLTGDWVGGFERGAEWVYVRASFRADKDGTHGTLDIFQPPFFSTKGRPVSRVSRGREALRFEVTDQSDRFAFDVTSRDGALSGTVARPVGRCPSASTASPR